MKKKKNKDAILTVRVESDTLKLLRKHNADIAYLVRTALEKAAAQINA